MSTIVTEHKLLSLIECPICYKIMKAPILQCVKGHTICNECNEKIKQCPTCQDKIEGTRNFQLEVLCESITVQCKYEECGEVFLKQAIDDHEKKCEHKPIKCILTNVNQCVWKGPLSKAGAHLIEDHADKINLDSVVLPMKYLQEDTIHLIKFDENLFVLCIECHDVNSFHFCVSSVNKIPGVDYQFKISIPEDDSEMMIINKCRDPNVCDQIVITVPDILDKYDSFKMSILKREIGREQ